MTGFDGKFDKPFEKRLADAMSDREHQVEIDPNAWQTHLDLVRAQSGGAPGRPAMLGRWRAPALVAASVVAVGLIGGIVAQSGLLGSNPVSPAGPDSGAVTAPVSPGPATSQGPGPGTPTSTGALAGTGYAPPRASAPGAPERSDRGLTPTNPVAPRLAPPAVTSTAPAAPVDVTTMAPTESDGPVSSPPMVTSSKPDISESHTAGDAAGSGPGATTMIDLSRLVRCGAQLPDLDKITTAVTVETGPNGDVVNEGTQAPPLLAVGYAVVGADGRIASVTGGDATLQKTAAPTLSSGRTVRSDEPSMRPTGLCASTSGPDATTAIQQRVGEPATSSAESPVFQVGLDSAVPPGTYDAVDIVLVGADLAHAVAYRTGPVWQFTTG